MTAQRGWWNMSCWNALSQEQQDRLIEIGNLEIGSRAEGTGCSNPAEVEIATMWDRSPGPRFYCIPCGIAYLQQVDATYPEEPEQEST